MKRKTSTSTIQETYAIADKIFTDIEEAKAYAKKIAAQAPHGRTALALLPVGNYTTNKKHKHSDCKKTEERKIMKNKKPSSTSSPKKEKKLRPNPFAGKADIYLTPNKIAVTVTRNVRTKRGFSQTKQTKYYEQNDCNTRLLKKANRNVVRVGRTGNNYRTV